MIFFKGWWILYKKELKDAFFQPLVFVLSGLFILLTGWLFFNYLMAAKDPSSQTMYDAVFVPFFGNLNFIFLFLAPLLTMRQLAEEKKLKTLEALTLSDLTDNQIILAKWTASCTVACFMLMATLLFPIILAFSGYSHWDLVASAYTGTFLCITCYMAVGLFASSLTENQIIASLLSFSFLLGIMLLVVTGQSVDNYMLVQIFQYSATPVHFESFVRGGPRSYNFVYFMSFTGFFLYLSSIRLGARKW